MERLFKKTHLKFWVENYENSGKNRNISLNFMCFDNVEEEKMQCLEKYERSKMLMEKTGPFQNPLQCFCTISLFSMMVRRKTIQCLEIDGESKSWSEKWENSCLCVYIRYRRTFQPFAVKMSLNMLLITKNVFTTKYFENTLIKPQNGKIRLIVNYLFVWDLARNHSWTVLQRENEKKIEKNLKNVGVEYI